MKTFLCNSTVRCFLGTAVFLGLPIRTPSVYATSALGPVRMENATQGVFRAPLSPAEKTKRKMGEIVIPEVKFTELPLSRVAEVLSEMTREMDKSDSPTKGVVILVNLPPGQSPEPLVTIPLLTNYKLADVLNVVTAVSGTRWMVSGPYISILPGY